jgi:hypothetical protein
MFDRLAAQMPEAKILTPSFLHITRERPDFKPKVAAE